MPLSHLTCSGFAPAGLFAGRGRFYATFVVDMCKVACVHLSFTGNDSAILMQHSGRE